MVELWWVALDREGVTPDMFEQREVLDPDVGNGKLLLGEGS